MHFVANYLNTELEAAVGLIQIIRGTATGLNYDRNSDFLGSTYLSNFPLIHCCWFHPINCQLFDLELGAAHYCLGFECQIHVAAMENFLLQQDDYSQLSAANYATKLASVGVMVLIAAFIDGWFEQPFVQLIFVNFSIDQASKRIDQESRRVRNAALVFYVLDFAWYICE